MLSNVSDYNFEEYCQAFIIEWVLVLFGCLDGKCPPTERLAAF
jgi:hypothetical protein